jgi:D-glycero-alpha-D-manno-heptose 1-phosphate guanylyltransferase
LITTAIILAGGFGTRLQSVVADVPKPMAPVNGEPFLSYQLRYLRSSGIKTIVISTGHLAEKIKSFYGAEFEGLTLIYSHEEKPLGTGGGIKLALDKTKEEDVLVLNGDSFFDVNISSFYELHQEQHSDASLALRRVEDASRYGMIEQGESNRIISFREKHNIAQPGLINGGVYILNKRKFFQRTEGLISFSIEKDFFERQLNELVIKGFEFSGYFIDIGIPADYQKAQDDFKGFKYR